MFLTPNLFLISKPQLEIMMPSEQSFSEICRRKQAWQSSVPKVLLRHEKTMQSKEDSDSGTAVVFNVWLPTF